MKTAGLILFVIGAIAAITSNVISILDTSGASDGGVGLLLLTITLIGYLLWRRTPGDRADPVQR